MNRYKIEAGKAHAVGEDPECEDECLGDQELGRAEIAGKRFGFLPEPVAAEYRRQVAGGRDDENLVDAGSQGRASRLAPTQMPANDVWPAWLIYRLESPIDAYSRRRPDGGPIWLSAVTRSDRL